MLETASPRSRSACDSLAKHPENANRIHLGSITGNRLTSIYFCLFVIILHRAIIAIASYLNYITVQFWPEKKLLQDILQPLFFYACKQASVFFSLDSRKTSDCEPYLAHNPLD